MKSLSDNRLIEIMNLYTFSGPRYSIVIFDEKYLIPKNDTELQQHISSLYSSMKHESETKSKQLNTDHQIL